MTKGTKVLLLSGLLLVLVVSVARIAVGGMKYGEFGVIVNTSDLQNKWAQGNLGGTRNTANNIEYIGCSQISYLTADSWVESFAYCYAADAQNPQHYYSCFLNYNAYTQAERIFATIRSLDGDATLYFRGDNGGNCKEIQVYKSSTYAPKQP